MKVIRTLFLVGIAVCCTSLLAQQDAGAAKSKPKMSDQSQSMPMPKPSPEMTKLIKMIGGNWKVMEKHEPNPMMPNGGTGEGMAKLHPGPGKLSLMESYHSKGAMGGDFNGMGTFWWDPKSNAYRGVWCDNMSPNGCDDSGTTKWEGDKLVGNMESEMNGQKMYSRFTYSDFKPDSFVMTMEMGPDPGKMQKAMTITYTRAAEGGKM